MAKFSESGWSLLGYLDSEDKETAILINAGNCLSTDTA